MKVKMMPVMILNINAVETCRDIRGCMKAEKIRYAMHDDDDHLCILSIYMIHRWLTTRAEVRKELQLYWPFRDDTAVTDVTVILVIPCMS